MALLEAKTPLSELPGLSKGILEKLTENSIKTIEELADTPIDDLTKIEGLGPKSAEKIIASVKEYYIQYAQAAEAKRVAEAEQENKQDGSVKDEVTQEETVSLAEEDSGSKPSDGSVDVIVEENTEEKVEGD